MQLSKCMWQSKESKLKAKDKKVYGFTKNQRCKGLLLDPQGMVQKLSYRITLRGQCQPNCILRVAEREREMKKQNKTQEKKGLKRSKVSVLKFPFCPFKLFNIYNIRIIIFLHIHSTFLSFHFHHKLLDILYIYDPTLISLYIRSEISQF